jgi:hypothetical protein
LSQRAIQAPNLSANVFVYYEGHLASFPNIMVGKLLLNSRYLIFHIYEPRYSGILETPHLQSTGRVLSIALNKIMDVTVESGVRAKRSRPNWKNRDDFGKKSSGERAINTHPGFLDDAENYSKLMLTVETENAVEIATFEVHNPQMWEQSIKSHIAKSLG